MTVFDLSSSYDLSTTQALEGSMLKQNILHLTNVTLQDAGQYICMAESVHRGHAVQAMQSAWLDVLPGETL